MTTSNPLREYNQNRFCAKYNISPSTFTSSCITWEVLTDITDNFLSNEVSSCLDEILLRYQTKFSTIERAHSVYGRKKDPLHLAEKIIRKNGEIISDGSSITIGNYFEKITDLVAFRILHLYKSDWIAIHSQLLHMFGQQLVGKVEAHLREGDDDKQFRDAGVEIIKDGPYRSVHYHIKDGETDVTFELQVRTMFEDAWGEVDHDVRYPYNTGNTALSDYLALLSRTAGACDEMAQFLHNHYAFIKESTNYPNISVSAMEMIKNRIERSSDEHLIVDIEELFSNLENQMSEIMMNALPQLIE